MRLTGLLATAAVLSMAAAPVLAAPANHAAKLSLVQTDSGGSASAKQAGKSHATTLVLAGAAVAAVVVGAVALSHHDSKAASA